MDHAVRDASADFIESLCAEYQKHNQIDPAFYERYRVKRGLRNADGTGVMAGVTQIGNVMGYYVQDGERIPAPGKLVYRGIDVEELINGFVSEGRFGFEETAYLLLFGALPTRAQLTAFEGLLSAHRALPPMFTEMCIRDSSYTTSVMCSNTLAGSSTRTPMSTWLLMSWMPSSLHWLENHSAPERPGPAMSQVQSTSSPLSVMRR